MGNQRAELPAIAVDAERAREFVMARGTARDRARVEGIFGHSGPDRAVVQELEELQNPDGGFPIRQEAGEPSSIDATCFILAQLKEIPPLGGSPMASRALAFLRRAQRPDGSWAESPAVQALAPAWSQEANPQAVAYLTANATFALLTMEPEHLDPIARASRWLRIELGRVGAGEEAPSQTLFLAAAIWTQVLGMGATEKSWAYELLSKRELSAAEIAWWLSLPLATGLEGRFVLLAMRLLQQLAGMQQANGSWPAEEGYPLESTIAALRVFRGYRVI